MGFTISARYVYSKADGGLILVRCAPPREVWEQIKFCEPDRSVVQAMRSLAELAAEAADGSILLTTGPGAARVLLDLPADGERLAQEGCPQKPPYNYQCLPGGRADPGGAGWDGAKGAEEARQPWRCP